MSHTFTDYWAVRNPDGSHDVYPYYIAGVGAVRVFGAHLGHFPPGYSIYQDPPGTGGGGGGTPPTGGNALSRNTGGASLSTAKQPTTPSGGGGSGIHKDSSSATVGPKTGPEEPPPNEGCDDAMSTTVDRGSQTSGDFKIEDTLAQPLIGGMTPLPLYSSADIVGEPLFTIPSYIEHDPDSGKTKTYHPGSGDGLIVIHPPELEDYHLYGSGVTPNSAWPSDLSQTTFLLMHGGVDGATGLARSKLAFGLPLRTTTSPADGWVFEEGLTNGSTDSIGLRVFPTDAAGDRDVASDRYFDIKSVIQGAAWLELPEIATPGVEHAGYGQFYVKTDSLPYFKDDGGNEFPLVTDICSQTDVDGFKSRDAFPDDLDHIIIDDCDTEGLRKIALLDASAVGVAGGRLDTSGNHNSMLEDGDVATLFYTNFTSNEILLCIDALTNTNRVCAIITAAGGVPNISGATLADNTNYDIFAFWDDIDEAVDIEALAWTDDTSRATGIGISSAQRNIGLFLAGDCTRRYIGTIRTTTGGTPIVDTLTQRFINNHYNKVDRPIYRAYSNADHVYTSSTIREWAGVSAPTRFIFGVATRNRIFLKATCQMEGGRSTIGTIGIGIDTTTAYTTGGYDGLVVANGGAEAGITWGEGEEIGLHLATLNQATVTTTSNKTYISQGVGPPATQCTVLTGWITA